MLIYYFKSLPVLFWQKILQGLNYLPHHHPILADDLEMIDSCGKPLERLHGDGVCSGA
jgi:hypothetical protein